MISSVVTPSISFSGVSMIRWFITGLETRRTSSGVTKFLPLKAANAFELRKIASDARGEAPRKMLPWFLVACVIFAM